MRTFHVATSCHNMPSIEASDMTLDECRLLRGIVTNNRCDSVDYKASRNTGAFLQGYREPMEGARDGWCLVEFWSRNTAAIDRFVAHVNAEFAKEVPS